MTQRPANRMFRELDAILVGSIHMMAGEQIGWYKLLDLLGTGGMAKVYLAEDQRLGRKVALKVLPADAVQNPERVRRFEQEARAASALNHPNILTIFDIGNVDSTKFIATEFVEGVTVRDVVSAKTAFLK
ncbi:MAG: protein kinase domain-containing protein, partial [Candidatus Angelobacter sp.]